MEHTKESIIGLLERNPIAVERALVAIFKRQTRVEQASESTKEDNGVGFSGVHAKYGSYMAKWVMEGKHLDGKHLEKARNMAKRYWKQLLTIANQKGE